jgi:pentatricopeptide repeat protein
MKKTTTKKKKNYPDVILNQVIYSTVISAFANYCASSFASYSYMTEEDINYENNNISTTATISSGSGSSSSGDRIDNDEIVKLALEVLNRGICTLSYNTMSCPKGSGGSSSSSSSNSSMTMMGVVGYNAVISTMANTGKWRMAVQLLGEMILHSSISSNTPTTTATDDSLRRSNPSFIPLEAMRDDIYNTPLLVHQHSSTKTSNYDTSCTIITPKPDSVTFGSVLSACEKSCQWTTVLDIANAAMEYGVRLDGIALTSILHACQNLGLADEALYYLDLMKQLGDDNNNQLNNNNEISSQKQNGIRKTNGRQRKGARQELRGPDGVAYRLAISACARSPGGQRWQDGIRLLREMKSISSSSTSEDDVATNCRPDVMAYTTAIAGCSEAGEYTHAISLISEMRKEGIQPNVMTFSAVINACATASAKMARRRDEEDYTMSTTSGNNDSFATTNIDDVRLPMKRALRLLDAMKLPTSLVKPNIVTYNAAIRACAEGLNLDGAFDLLRQLKEDGLEPTIVTYGSLMTACERVGDVEAASKVFRMVKEEDGRQSIRDDNNDTSSNEKEHLRANEIIYGAAISCCRKAHEPERALLLLRKMMSEKLEPNTVTFNTVIAALSEGRLSDSIATSNDNSLLEKALAVYRVMKSKNAPTGVSPNRKTYNILIRSLANNLQPGIAESLLIDMRNAKFVPDVDLYTMTVRSYERCGNPIKALALMEYMREMGYDFYSVKVFDEAFKNGVKVLNRLNRIGRGLTSAGWSDNSPYSSSYGMSEELIDFIDDGELI